jgi:hypothetical protein
VLAPVVAAIEDNLAIGNQPLRVLIGSLVELHG